MNPTKRNHYNPCFWTALWNVNYFRLAQKNGNNERRTARDQVVHVLGLRSQKVLKSSVERVHYDKNLGIAEITREAAESFVRRHHPDQYDKFLHDNKTSSYPIYLDFENILTGIEATPPYEVLLKVALTQSVDNLIEKTYLASFIVLHCLRSHAIMNSMIDWHEELGYAKFEHLVTLKWMLSEPSFLFKLIYPLLSSRWVLYTCTDHTLPLCDSPVLVLPESTMVVLSPRLLLEVFPLIRTPTEILPLINPLHPQKLDEYRRRTIGNTFREIIGEQPVLEEWKATNEFCTRANLMKDIKKYNTMVRLDGERELWHLNAYGNST